MHGPMFNGGIFPQRRETVIIENNYCGTSGGGFGNIFSGLGSVCAGVFAGLSIASLFSPGGSSYPMGGGMGMGMQPVFNQMPTPMPMQMPMPMTGTPQSDPANAQVESIMNNFMQATPLATPAPAAASESKPVASNASADNNLGKKFADWSENNASKSSKGEQVEDFAFVGDDYAQAIKKGDNKGAADIYKTDITKLSKDTIALQDTNHDGKISYDEYKAKELADYQKTFPDIKALPSDLEESTRKAFDNMNLDGSKDGLDYKEVASVDNWYDINIDTGEMNGKIRMKDFSAHSQELSQDGTKDKLQKRYDFLFGANS